MHLKTLALGAAILALSACGSKTGPDANATGDSGMTAESISSNDVTAIDAVTGDAANMAADVDYSNIDTSAEANGSGAEAAAKPAAKKATKPARTTDAAVPATQDDTNTVQ